MEPNDPIAEARDAMPAPPLPVQTLDYSPPRKSGRPGILTAVGVMSIVIGALSLLMGCSSVFMLVMMQAMSRAAPPPAPATVPATVPAAAVMFPFPPMDLTALITGGIDALLRLALAVLLIVAGTLVLRDHHLGRRLHVIWAWVKIPAALLGAIVAWRQTSGMFVNMPATPGVTPQYMSMTMLVTSFIQAGVACAYPVGVLIVMKTQAVRDYYATQFGGDRSAG
jgi:hypothetical protein